MVVQVWRSRSAYDAVVAPIRRILLLLAALGAVGTWLWIAAVRAAPGVRARKDAARDARGAPAERVVTATEDQSAA